MAEFFGYEIKRKKEATGAKSFVAPSDEDGTLDIAGGAGFFSQYVNLDKAAKNDWDLIRKYRTTAEAPECDQAIDDIISDRPLKHKEALTQYREKYEEFIFAKAWHEEGHDGTGAAGFICLSVEEKKEVRHELIKEILAGKIPEIKDSHESADKRLNDIYQKVIMRLKQSPYRVGRSNCTDLVLRKTQRLWIADLIGCD